MSEQGAQHAEARAHNQPRIYSVDEVSEVFLDEWILMRVTGREHGVPARGEIIEHAKRRKDIQPRVLEAIDSMKQNRPCVLRISGIQAASTGRKVP